MRELFDVSNQREIIERYSFFTRYLFSCLTDADFIDTERFVTPNTDRGMDGDFQKAYEKVCEKLNSFKNRNQTSRIKKYYTKNRFIKALNRMRMCIHWNMPTGAEKLFAV